MGIFIQNNQELKTVEVVLHVFNDSLYTLRLEENSKENKADITICIRIIDFLIKGVNEYANRKDVDSRSSIGEIKPLD